MTNVKTTAKPGDPFLSQFSRRDFIKMGATASAGTYFFLKGLGPGGSFFNSSLASPTSSIDGLDLEETSPIARLSGPFANPQFNGDDFARAHGALWDIEGYIRGKGGRPTSITQQTSVVVIGGGVSGLLSTYFLRDHSPVLLEQAARFGGNSKGEKFGNTAFSIGAVYMDQPHPGGDIEKLFRELGIEKSYRAENPSNAMVDFKGAGLKKIWRGETDPKAKASFLKVDAELKRINNEEYPDIPWTSSSEMALDRFKALDKLTAEQWLRGTFPDLHPHVEEYFQLYCWSSLGGSIDEISAIQFLNFAAAECDGIIAFPGGNSYVCESIHRTLAKTLPSENLQAKAMVLEVKNVTDGVEVLYENSAGRLQILKSKYAIVATPKYVAGKIVKDLPAAQSSTWADLNYRAYVVANVLLKKKFVDPSFDILCMEGTPPPSQRFSTANARPWTDVVCADWTTESRSDSSVLTIFRPYPFDGARNVLYSQSSFAKIKADILAELPSLLNDLGESPDDIADIRLTRWGHSIPLGRPGMASDGTLELIRAPHVHIAFANQDCFMNPAFESCFSSAKEASAMIRAQLT
jgi:hypothetical protein